MTKDRGNIGRYNLPRYSAPVPWYSCTALHKCHFGEADRIPRSHQGPAGRLEQLPEPLRDFEAANLGSSPSVAGRLTGDEHPLVLNWILVYISKSK